MVIYHKVAPSVAQTGKKKENLFTSHGFFWTDEIYPNRFSQPTSALYFNKLNLK